MDDWATYRNGNYMVHLNLNDGTKIRKTDDNEFKAAFAENMDVKICNYCDMNCPMCHEGSSTSGKFADIMNEAFIDTLHPYQELAIGGGDATSHPDLIPFLKKLKEKHVIANMTVNQMHFMKKQELIRSLVDQKLIYGLGVSLVNPSLEFNNLISQYPNAVVHVISGIFSETDFDALPNDAKLLILGYKELRRGVDYLDSNIHSAYYNTRWLYDNLDTVIHSFKVVSFDNLAIEQLGVKRLLTDEEWESFYMGDDGTSTFYIDMVERKFARSSTAPMDERYDLLNSVDDMFAEVRNGLTRHSNL